MGDNPSHIATCEKGDNPSHRASCEKGDNPSHIASCEKGNNPSHTNSNNTAPSIGTIAGWGLELSLW